MAVPATLLVLLLAIPLAAATVPTPRMAPQFSLPGRTGVVALDSLRGREVLVDFWASWCEPCRKSFPWLKSLHERLSARGLTIVAINLDKSRPPAAEFLQQFPAPFLVAYDPAGRIAEAFDVRAMPTSFLIDTTGAILYVHAGFDPRKTAPLETLIQEHLPR